MRPELSAKRDCDIRTDVHPYWPRPSQWPDAQQESIEQTVLFDHRGVRGQRARQQARLDDVFENRIEALSRSGLAGMPAVEADGRVLGYEDLDGASNQLARYLRLHGLTAGDRVALLLDCPTDLYVAVLAAMKIGAAYVSLDLRLTTDQLASILDDVHVQIVLSTSRCSDRLSWVDLLIRGAPRSLDLDRVAAEIAEQDPRRLSEVERGAGRQSLAYIVYTFGSDGRPRGVAVDHPAIAHFVEVAADVYGLHDEDRVYQGLSLGSDLSIEETWVPWAVGATVVAPPTATGLRGRSLARFLRARGVTVLRCSSEVLSTLDEDLPDLRLLVVSGAPCPPELVARWHRADRRIIGTYGPAEATVTTSCAELRPDDAPSLGTPLPGYSVVVLDPDDPYRALPHGEVGEIGIAGIGLARGYVNRYRHAREAFVADFVGIPDNPSGRIYRTGDLGRITSDGEIEYHDRLGGRARWDRLEVAGRGPVPTVPDPRPATDSLWPLRRPDVGLDAARPVSTNRSRAAARPTNAPQPTTPTPRHISPTRPGSRVEVLLAEVLAGSLDLEQVPTDAHFFNDLDADSMIMARFCARVRKHPDLPSVSMTDIYEHPTIAGLAAAIAPAHIAIASPATPTPCADVLLGELLAEILDREQVPTDAHFFNDLDADSMIMARFCARVRKHPDLPAVGIKDIYEYPTIAELSATLAPSSTAAASAERSAAPSDPELVAPPPAEEARQRPHRGERPKQRTISTARYVVCGLAQLLFFLGYTYLAALVVVGGYEWLRVSPTLLDLYERAVVIGALATIALCALPVLFKWILVGRWRSREFPVWRLTYFRFWIVKTLLRANPIVLFAGSPLYTLYLRALGAKIGRGAVVLSRDLPVCTDLLVIGENSVVRKDSSLSCYRAVNGYIQTGRVSLGQDVLVGEMTVLDIDTAMADGATLGHSSSLHTGQRVPAGETWHGSPAQPAGVDYRAVPTTHAGRLRRIVYPLVQVALALSLLVPLVTGGAVFLVREIPHLNQLLHPEPGTFLTPLFWIETLAVSLVAYFGLMAVGLVLVASLPRVLARPFEPNKVYPLYGVHYFLHQTITTLTNLKAFTMLFGDSSAIPHYLRFLGYRLTPLTQTGSNFGMLVKHETPFHSTIGTGTVVADGLSVVNADFSATSFRVSPTHIGAHNFLGNQITYPSQGRTGDDCLLATKVMVPIDGQLRTGVGLLGSPSFEIPRTVERDRGLKQDPESRRRALRAKNRHNAITMTMHLFVRWFLLLGLALIAAGVASIHMAYGAAELVLVQFLLLLFSTGWLVAVERAAARLQALAPAGCSIYDQTFWRHERFWKVPSMEWVQAFNGTPFKNVVWRLLGVRIGARVFDDGCALIEKTFVTIGDECTLNARSIVQCHSQEDNAFKSDRVKIGAGCTLGVSAFVHYGTNVGDAVLLEPDTFLMKGEEVPACERWGGNPARPMAA